jgi:hypothetical protein
MIGSELIFQTTDNWTSSQSEEFIRKVVRSVKLSIKYKKFCQMKKNIFILIAIFSVMVVSATVINISIAGNNQESIEFNFKNNQSLTEEGPCDYTDGQKMESKEVDTGFYVIINGKKEPVYKTVKCCVSDPDSACNSDNASSSSEC